MELELKTTRVFKRNREALLDPNIRYIINQGSTRSSKTYSIFQLLILYALTNKDKRVNVVRKSKSTLVATALQDFKEVFDSLNISHLAKYNASTHFYKFTSGTRISFIGADDPQKLRGLKHDIVYLNEANELKIEDYDQIAMRTSNTIIMDFNPSDQFSYIYEVLKSPKAIKIHSTYKDNPYVSQSNIDQIESYKLTDPEKWQVFGLGLNVIRKERIFPKIEYKPFPKDLDYVYGMDFGYNDPTTLIKVAIKDGNLYIKEIMYQKRFTLNRIIEMMDDLGVNKKNRIYADSSRPDMIESIKRAGYYITKSNKKIKEGLDFMKSHKIFIDPNSIETSKEFQNYTYKKKYDQILEDPIDFMNHSIDAARYAAISYKRGFKTSFGFA